MISANRSAIVQQNLNVIINQPSMMQTIPLQRDPMDHNKITDDVIKQCNSKQLNQVKYVIGDS